MPWRDRPGRPTCSAQAGMADEAIGLYRRAIKRWRRRPRNIASTSASIIISPEAAGRRPGHLDRRPRRARSRNARDPGPAGRGPGGLRLPGKEAVAADGRRRASSNRTTSTSGSSLADLLGSRSNSPADGLEGAGIRPSPRSWPTADEQIRGGARTGEVKSIPGGEAPSPPADRWPSRPRTSRPKPRRDRRSLDPAGPAPDEADQQADRGRFGPSPSATAARPEVGTPPGVRLGPAPAKGRATSWRSGRRLADPRPDWIGGTEDGLPDRPSPSSKPASARPRPRRPSTAGRELLAASPGNAERQPSSSPSFASAWARRIEEGLDALRRSRLEVQPVRPQDHAHPGRRTWPASSGTRRRSSCSGGPSTRSPETSTPGLAIVSRLADQYSAEATSSTA